MGRMFQGAKAFNQPLNTWDVSSVRRMTDMFRDAVAFNQPLDRWDVSSVCNMKDMFSGAKRFKKYPAQWVIPETQPDRMFSGTPLYEKSLKTPLKTDPERTCYPFY